MADSRTTACNSSGRHVRTYKNCSHDQLPELTNFKPRTQRMNQEKMRQMKPAEFASLLCEKLEKLKLNSEGGSKKSNENLMSPVLNQRLNSPHNNMYLPKFYPQDNDTIDSDSQSWVMPPASDRYSIAGASSHSGSGANTEIQKNKNIKEKAKELRNAVHHSLRNGLGECECHSCDLKRHEISYKFGGYNMKEHHHTAEFSRNPVFPGQQSCCCQSKDSYCTNQSHSNQSHRKYNSEESSHRFGDYVHENIPEDVAPPVDTTKIIAWMERNEKYKHETAYPDPMPSPAVRRKKQPSDYDRNNVTQAVQPIAQDLGMPLLPQPDTGNVLQEVKRVLEEPEKQRVSPVKKVSSRSHQSHQSRMQSTYYYMDQHSAYSDTSYEQPGSSTSANWSLSDTASRSSHNPSQISTVPSSASRLWNPEGYYDSSSDVRLESKSGARSHSTGKHSSQHYGSRSDHRSNVRHDYHNDIRSQKTGRSHGSHSSKGQMTTITYYFGVDPIPFRISVPSYEVTLGQFKAETKKGNFRFFFKTISIDDGEVVYEEVRHDHEILPRFKDKIIGKVEKIE